MATQNRFVTNRRAESGANIECTKTRHLRVYRYMRYIAYCDNLNMRYYVNESGFLHIRRNPSMA